MPALETIVASLRSAPSLAVDVGRPTYEAWRNDRTLRLGAGLAYYALFTVVPLLALTAALADRVFGVADMQAYFSQLLAGLGLDETDTVSTALTEELGQLQVGSSLGIVGLTTLLFASSLVFLALVDAVNVIWNVPVRRGIWYSVRRRLISFVMVLTSGGVLIAGVAVSAVTGMAERIVPGNIGVLETLSPVISGLASWAALVAAIAMLFRYIGPVRVPWSVALSSAAISSVLLYLGAVGFGWYLNEFGGSSVSGAFGALLVALSFVYYETQIVLAGVQLVKVLTARRDH
jgi:membrane protein